MDTPVNRLNLPIPMGRPLMGQDLLDTVNVLIPSAPGFTVTALVSTVGKVTAFTAGPPAAVTLQTADGTVLTVGRAAMYSPTVGDQVFVISNGRMTIALCAIA
jgi:hypothetical protein